ncbi:three-helix bundle dimerization domain-containing protein [Streptomyces sp. NPDC002004]
MTTAPQPHRGNDRPPSREDTVGPWQERPTEPPGSAAQSAARHEQQDELAAVRRVAEHLQSVYPSIDAATVDALVHQAHSRLSAARIRTYVPILVERRARLLLVAVMREARPATPPPAAAPPRPD